MVYCGCNGCRCLGMFVYGLRIRMQYLIKTYTDVGDIVLDNCMGSGSTGIASVKTGRHFIGIEKNKKYFDIASKRIGES